jgi:hypothetical protein
VVVSPRINRAPVEVAKGILVHELGHSIDFHCYGSRCIPFSSTWTLRLALPLVRFDAHVACSNLLMMMHAFLIRLESFSGFCEVVLSKGRLWQCLAQKLNAAKDNQHLFTAAHEDVKKC